MTNANNPIIKWPLFKKKNLLKSWSHVFTVPRLTLTSPGLAWRQCCVPSPYTVGEMNHPDITAYPLSNWRAPNNASPQACCLAARAHTCYIVLKLASKTVGFCYVPLHWCPRQRVCTDCNCTSLANEPFFLQNSLSLVNNSKLSVLVLWPLTGNYRSFLL